MTSDKLHSLWEKAAEEYVKEIIRDAEAHQYDVPVDKATERKILRMIRKDHARTKRNELWLKLRIPLVACLVLISLLFAACMASTTVRNAIWEVFLSWNDDYVKVDFVDPATTTVPGTTTATDDPAVTTTVPEPTSEAPQSIEEVNVPGYMPVGFTTKSSMRNDVFSIYYYNENEENVIEYHQNIILANGFGDAEGGTATEITVNGLKAVLITYEDDPNVYNLFWQDNQYRYNIYAYLEDYNELIKLATSVEVK